MSTDLSQNELEELVVGKNQKPTVLFYEKARIDVEASKREGRRIYQTLIYIKERQVGVTDWIPQIAKKHHIKTYPNEYQDFLNNRGSKKSPPITIIPNITPAEMQELMDFGIRTIEQLAEAVTVPPHLSHIQKSAIVFQSVFKEQKNANQKESHEEEATQPIPEGRGEFQNNGGSEPFTLKGRDLPETDRQNDSFDVGQCSIPASIEDSKRKAAERSCASGRINNHSPKLSSNWSISL